MGNINKVCKKLSFFAKKKIKNDNKSKYNENIKIENFPTIHKKENQAHDNEIQNIEEIKNNSCLINEKINLEEKCGTFNDKFFEDITQKVFYRFHKKVLFYFYRMLIKKIKLIKMIYISMKKTICIIKKNFLKKI